MVVLKVITWNKMSGYYQRQDYVRSKSCKNLIVRPSIIPLQQVDSGGRKLDYQCEEGAGHRFKYPPQKFLYCHCYRLIYFDQRVHVSPLTKDVTLNTSMLLFQALSKRPYSATSWWTHPNVTLGHNMRFRPWKFKTENAIKQLQKPTDLNFKENNIIPQKYSNGTSSQMCYTED